MADDQAFHSADTPAKCRAVTVRPKSDGKGENEGGRWPMAGFVAQLIACDRRLAQFRRARREDPTCAATAYGAGAGRGAHLAVDLKV